MEARRIGMEASIITTFLRDGGMYFLLMTLSYVADFFVSFPKLTPIRGMNSESAPPVLLGVNFSFIVGPMVVSRIILNLRKVSEKTITGGLSATVGGPGLSDMNFHASMADELSGELRFDEDEVEAEDAVDEVELEATPALQPERLIDIEEDCEPVASGSGVMLV